MIISEQCTAQKKIRKNNVLFSLIVSFTVVVFKAADCLNIWPTCCIGTRIHMWNDEFIFYRCIAHRKMTVYISFHRYPFSDSEHASLFAKITRGHFIIPDCLSTRAKCLIHSLLQREPSERLSAADVLLHPWLTREEEVETTVRGDQMVPEYQAKWTAYQEKIVRHFLD